MKKFVLTKNSFDTFLGINNDEMNQIKGGLSYNYEPYLPTIAYQPTEELEHNLELEGDYYECAYGFVWDNILNKCVEA